MTVPAGRRQKELEQIDEYDIVVTSYDLLQTRSALLYEHTFRFEIIDRRSISKCIYSECSSQVVKSNFKVCPDERGGEQTQPNCGAFLILSDAPFYFLPFKTCLRYRL